MIYFRIRKIKNHFLTDLLCDYCENNMVVKEYFKVDNNLCCKACFKEYYPDLVRCKGQDCMVYDHVKNFNSGLCERCDELEMVYVNNYRD